MTKDQKRAATVAAAGGGGLFLLYRHQQKNASTGHGPPPVTNAGAFGQVAPYTPQDPVPLDPGQSIYDPNSEGLLNTPTAFPPGPGAQPQATTAAAPQYVVKVNYGRRSSVRAGKPNHRPRRRKHPNRKRKVTHG